MTTNERRPRTHHGLAVRRLRDMMDIKQSALADALNASQQYVSQLEAKQTIEESMLVKIAKCLHIPVELIKNYDHEKAVEIVINSNTFDTSDNAKVVEVNTIENYNSVKDMKEIFHVLIEEKDKRLAEKDRYISELEELLKEKKNKKEE